MPTILVVEDHAMSRQVLKTLFGYMGHRVLEAADGSAALALARSEHPDLVITDILMPTMDGVEFVRRLRAEDALKNTPVIFYSATYRMPEAVRLGMECGVDRVIPKPSDPVFILKTVNEILGLSPVDTAPPPTADQLYSSLRKSESFQSAGLRLAAVMDLSFHLVSQRDPAKLMFSFCRAAQDIMNCKCAVLGLLQDNGPARYFNGSDKHNEPSEACPSDLLPLAEIMERVVAQRSTLRRHLSDAVSIPQSAIRNPKSEIQPSFRSLLAIPVASPGRVYGWICLADKRDGSPFSDGDEEIGVALSAQAAIAYENILLVEELRRRALLLEQSNKDLQDFAFVASHDLQEPLRKVVSFGEILQCDYAGALDKQGSDYLARMVRASARMQELIRELLKLSRVSTQGGSFFPTDLGKVVQGVVTDLEVHFGETGGTVRVGTLPMVEADELQMRQLFQNLISNSLKFRRKDAAPVVIVEATLLDDGHCEVTVSDNGIGFDMKYAERVFRPFQRLHSQDAYDGSGMGLSICKKIVERHGGAITVESEPVKGATFKIRLPISGFRGGG